jgi:hypothetical protein
MMPKLVLMIMSLAAPPALAAEPRTQAAVIAADEAWGDAEIAGNAAFVDQLLLPGYVSIGADGKVTSKATIVAGARGRTEEARAKLSDQVAAWMKAHPMRAEVMIADDTAILKWVSAKPGAGGAVSSCDIFVYQDGRWRAIYSQHSSASS